jgi:predicted GIY-YIG superfamily endonuclease
MRYVYLLQSTSHPGKRYIGISGDYRARLEQHNAGQSPHTAKYRPWRTVVVVRFEHDRAAEEFERYLKSGSGHAFARRHFWVGQNPP